MIYAFRHCFSPVWAISQSGGEYRKGRQQLIRKRDTKFQRTNTSRLS